MKIELLYDRNCNTYNLNINWNRKDIKELTQEKINDIVVFTQEEFIKTFYKYGILDIYGDNTILEDIYIAPDDNKLRTFKNAFYRFRKKVSSKFNIILEKNAIVEEKI